MNSPHKKISWILFFQFVNDKHKNPNNLVQDKSATFICWLEQLSDLEEWDMSHPLDLAGLSNQIPVF